MDKPPQLPELLTTAQARSVGEGHRSAGGRLSIEFRTGDLFNSGLPGIGHGCNCAGAMGKGIAVEFRRRWPDMYAEYKRRCTDGSFLPGDVFTWEATERVVFNLGTQRTWRTKAELPAIEQSVRTMLADAESRGLPAVGIPRIGAGLGGLNWPSVEQKLREVADESPVQLVVFEFRPPGQP